MPLKIDPWSFPELDAAAETADAGSTIVLAGGCFWCTEAVYRQLEGVLSVRPGYAGGTELTANYQDVCSGDTGHAEAIEIRFDPSRVALGQILKIFFSIAHDPTQLNRQGADVGTQYRSAIFHANEAQRLIAERYIAQIEAAGLFDLQLSGHTHQGQIFPFSLITRMVFPHHSGDYRLPGRGLLHVNRGTGTWGPPMRFLAPPEITVIDLLPASGQGGAK